MSRQYEFVFRRLEAPGEWQTCMGYGNTTRSAERSARGKLRSLGKDPQKFATVGPGRFVPSKKR